MKLVKTSMIACALSALIATPVLAQGAPPAKTGGAVQGKSMQGSTMGSGDEERMLSRARRARRRA